jgi:hypothetical protein
VLDHAYEPEHLAHVSHRAASGEAVLLAQRQPLPPSSGISRAVLLSTLAALAALTGAFPHTFARVQGADPLPIVERQRCEARHHSFRPPPINRHAPCPKERPCCRFSTCAAVRQLWQSWVRSRHVVAALVREQVPLSPAGIAATPKTRPTLKWFPPAVPSRRSLIRAVWWQGQPPRQLSG